MLDVFLAYAAGLLTLINPCVLPLLPLIAAGAIARHRLAPLAMSLGMGASFVVAGMGAFWLTRALGILPEDISFAVGWVMIGFGAILLVPQGQAGFARLAGAAAGGGTRLMGSFEGRGLWGEAAAGALLGLAWSPCIGPTLGAAIGLAAQGENLGQAFAIMVGFGAGAATIMLALAYGARALIGSHLNRLSRYAKPALGIGLVLVGVALVLGLDKAAEGWLVGILPQEFINLSVAI